MKKNSKINRRQFLTIVSGLCAWPIIPKSFYYFGRCIVQEKDSPKKILSKDFPNEIDIRGEVFITKKDFKKMHEKFNTMNETLKQMNEPLKPMQEQVKPMQEPMTWDKGHRT